MTTINYNISARWCTYIYTSAMVRFGDTTASDSPRYNTYWDLVACEFGGHDVN